jgi:YD repeat-containing protein
MYLTRSDCFRLFLIATVLFASGSGHSQLKPEARTVKGTKYWWAQPDAGKALLFQDSAGACQMLYEQPFETKVRAGKEVDVFTPEYSACAYGPLQTNSRRVVAKAFYIGPRSSTVEYAGQCRYKVVVTETIAGCGVSNTYVNESFFTTLADPRLTAFCPAGWKRSPTKPGYCEQDVPIPPCPDNCTNGGLPATSVGNPVGVDGVKHSNQTLLSVYNSDRRFGVQTSYAGNIYNAGGNALRDPFWFVDPVDRRIIIDPAEPLKRVVVTSARNGRVFSASASAGPWTAVDRHFKLTQTASGYTFYDPVAGQVDTYDLDGTLKSIHKLDGYKLTLITSGTTSVVLTVADQFGRNISFQGGTALESVSFPSGAQFQWQRGVGDFSSKVAYLVNPDTTRSQFLYTILPRYQGLASGATPSIDNFGEEVSVVDGQPSGSPQSMLQLTGGNSPIPLIGLVDELGVQVSTYTVTSTGTTVSTERAGGVNKYVVGTSSVASTITEPLGARQFFELAARNNDRSVVTQYRRTDSTNNSQSRTFAYTGDGLLSQVQTGGLSVASISTCFVQDPVRDLELKRLEGRATADCTNLVPQASTAERLVTTQWHPDWVLQSRVAAPKLVSTWVYQGQADPTASNAIANCLPAGTATLPNGKPLAVLCKRVEQATTDETGALGFAAIAQGAARVWTYTYNSDGQMLTAKGPRGGVNENTTYAYYSATDTAVPPKYYRGDLKTMTNAVGHVTTHNEYEPNGQLQKKTDANGTVTSYSYHIRGWLQQMSVASGGATRTTQWSYYPTGKLKQVTSPDGSYLFYAYDPAQRLVGIKDNLNNEVIYTLDNAGNRTKEEFKDPAGVLKRNIARSYDERGFAVSVTGGVQ